MGLTLNASLKIKGHPTLKQTLKVMGELRQLALDLPFEGVSEIRFHDRLSLADCVYDRHAQDQEWDLVGRTCQTKEGPKPPEWTACFDVWVGGNSEDIRVRVFRWPARSWVVRGDRKVRLHRTSGEDYCKTVYAMDPRHGGPQNFLLRHLSVLAFWEEVGRHPECEVEIDDEGYFGDYTARGQDFQGTRDVRKLLDAAGADLKMLAALRNALGPLAQSEIETFDDYAQLVVEGSDKLLDTPGGKELLELQKKVGMSWTIPPFKKNE